METTRPVKGRSLRPEGLKSEARRANMGGVLMEGMFPSPPARGLRSAVSSPKGVRGFDLAISNVL